MSFFTSKNRTSQVSLSSLDSDHSATEDVAYESSSSLDSSWIVHTQEQAHGETDEVAQGSDGADEEGAEEEVREAVHVPAKQARHIKRTKVSDRMSAAGSGRKSKRKQPRNRVERKGSVASSTPRKQATDRKHTSKITASSPPASPTPGSTRSGDQEDGQIDELTIGQRVCAQYGLQDRWPAIRGLLSHLLSEEERYSEGQAVGVDARGRRRQRSSEATKEDVNDTLAAQEEESWLIASIGVLQPVLARWKATQRLSQGERQLVRRVGKWLVGVARVGRHNDTLLERGGLPVLQTLTSSALWRENAVERAKYLVYSVIDPMDMDTSYSTVLGEGAFGVGRCSVCESD
jgi:hypothetical protein